MAVTREVAHMVSGSLALCSKMPVLNSAGSPQLLMKRTEKLVASKTQSAGRTFKEPALG